MRCQVSPLVSVSNTLQELNKQYEAKSVKCNELRTKLKECKAALSARSRELEVATKMLQKVAHEKKHLQVLDRIAAAGTSLAECNKEAVCSK
jgi:wobble nucleotide-excising tRNase